MLIDNDSPCDLLAGIVAGDCCRLGVDTRLRRELRGLAAEQALLFISTGDLSIIDHHAVRLQQSADIVCLSLGQRHPGGLDDTTIEDNKMLVETMKSVIKEITGK